MPESRRLAGTNGLWERKLAMSRHSAVQVARVSPLSSLRCECQAPVDLTLRALYTSFPQHLRDTPWAEGFELCRHHQLVYWYVTVHFVLSRVISLNLTTYLTFLCLGVHELLARIPKCAHRRRGQLPCRGRLSPARFTYRRRPEE